MPFGGYSDWDDCISKNSDKDDPEKYCGYIKHQTEERHRDFQRIHDEFCNYYKDPRRGDSEYYGWLKALGLDESVMYGGVTESFRWAQDMLNYIREDDEYKYYRVLVGFPVTSMNGNVYHERDLIAAATQLKGLHPNLNHKDEWHFKPGSRYGEITTEAAKYEDGAIEAIIKVSKQAVCPICSGRRMTELIDKKGIVNVSLQGACSNYRKGVCDGFQFDDKGFSLLTKDVLPGIPMARILPLEHIMVEALQTSSMTPTGRLTVKIRKKRKTMKEKRILKPKLVEDVDTSTQTQKDLRGTWGTELTKDSQIYDGDVDEYDNARTVVGESPTKRFISGQPMGDTIAMTPRSAEARAWEQEDNPALTNKEPEFTGVQGPFAPMDGPPTDEEQPKPEDGKEGPPKSAPAPTPDYPLSGQPEGTPPSFPAVTTPETEVGEEPPKADDKTVTGDTPAVEQDAEQPDAPCDPGYHKDADGYCVPNETPAEQAIGTSSTEPPPADPCPDGQHLNDAGQCVPDASEQDEPCEDGYHKDEEGNCVPDEPLEERVRRFKAENKARDLKGQCLRWEQMYRGLDKKFNEQLGANKTQEKRIQEAREERDKFHKQYTEAEIQLRHIKNDLVDLQEAKKKLERKVDELTSESEGLRKKYDNTLGMNLTLSQKLTKANEDYLNIAKNQEILAAKLTQARTNAKKTLKLKA